MELSVKLYIILLSSLILLSGCVHRVPVKKFNNLSIGMSKKDAINILGQPARVGATLQSDGKVTEGYVYNVDCTPGPLAWDDFRSFHVYFHDEKLVRWGQPNDWPAASDITQEIRIR